MSKYIFLATTATCVAKMEFAIATSYAEDFSLLMAQESVLGAGTIETVLISLNVA